MSNISNHTTELMAEMSANGIKPAQTLDLTSGLLCRFDIEGDKTGSKCGWVVCHTNADDSTVAVYGSWKTGQEHTYASNGSGSRMSRETVAAIEQAREQATQERERQAAKAMALCLSSWNTAKPATHHPYLARKGIKSHRARVNNGGALLVPVFDIAGSMISTQYIFQRNDGSFEKRFAKGARTHGGFCPFGSASDSSTILIAEGFATAASLHEATGLPVVAALSASNLLPVARQIHDKYPSKQYVVCADNDALSKENTGLVKAKDAALAIAAEVVYPVFDNDEIGTDFNDLALLRGNQAVRAMILGAIE